MHFNLRSLLIAAALFVSFEEVVCSPLAAAGRTLYTRQNDFVVVTGVTEGGDAPRLEIRQLEANATMWNLFVQSLESMMLEDQQDKISWYQIAGIHGRPYIEWDSSTGGGDRGYCPHSSNLFATWHRPYMALVEQRIHEYAVTIAEAFPAGPTRDMYRSAAASLRLPYWDWSANHDPVMSPGMTTENITVTRPDGRNESIYNPLYSYKFNPVSKVDFGDNQYGRWNETKRAASSLRRGATSRNDVVENTLTDSVASLRQRTYNLFTSVQNNFTSFASSSSGSGGDSLEAVHGVIHSSCTEGHMNPVDYSAFDFLFFLHHSNVDRLIALYQVLYPDTYVHRQAASGSTYTIAEGSVQGPGSDLTPFRYSDAGDYWTSNLCRNISSLHYTYPELQDNPTPQVLRSRINQLYGPKVTGLSSNDANDVLLPGGEATTSGNSLHVASPEVLQYAVKVSAPLNPIGGTYAIMFFLGQPSSDPSGWTTDPNFVGQHGVFSSTDGHNVDFMVSAEIQLTASLQARFQKGELRSLKQKAVFRYLKNNLRWAVLQGTQSVDSSKVPGITAQIISTNVKRNVKSTEFPQYFDSKVLGNVVELSSL
jgi:tyrosinase